MPRKAKEQIALPETEISTEVVSEAIALDVGNAETQSTVVSQAEITEEKPKAKAKRKSPKSDEDNSVAKSFYQLNLREIDRNLSPKEADEWNNIYASYRSGSILSGEIIGIDRHEQDVVDENGEVVHMVSHTLVMIAYRVKVYIAEKDIWLPDEEQESYTVTTMLGANIDYVITDIDREGEYAIASRALAMTKRRRSFLRSRYEIDGLVQCNPVVVSHNRMLVNFAGFDMTLTQKDLSYMAIADLQQKYYPGMELTAKLLDVVDDKPIISVKKVNPNPFDGAEERNPVGSRRMGVIEGKYGGGAFCVLPDEVTCLCIYSENLYDAQFHIGDSVRLKIRGYNYEKKLVYGVIVGKR